ncbi:MAG: PDZ domain-containing protein [Verrucomicrobiota bacterium]
MLNHLSLITLAFPLCLARVLAQDDGEVFSEEKRGNPAPVEVKEKGTALPWLGVAASVVPAVLRSQVNLKDGEGLVLDVIVPESPAGQAGLREHDILLGMDGQSLGSIEGLRSLVRECEVGQVVVLSLLRKGREEKVRVALGQRPAQPAEEPTTGFSLRSLPEVLSRFPQLESLLGDIGDLSRLPQSMHVEEESIQMVIDGKRSELVRDGEKTFFRVVEGEKVLYEAEETETMEVPVDYRQALSELRLLRKASRFLGFEMDIDLAKEKK